MQQRVLNLTTINRRCKNDKCKNDKRSIHRVSLFGKGSSCGHFCKWPSHVNIGTIATDAAAMTYSEPQGFSFHFHWTATITIDGTTTTTPIMVERQ